MTTTSDTTTSDTLRLAGKMVSTDLMSDSIRLALSVISGDLTSALLLADLVQETHGGNSGLITALVQEKVQAEREACAQLIEKMIPCGKDEGLDMEQYAILVPRFVLVKELAQAIRQRKET